MTDTRWTRFGDRASARRAAAWSLHPDTGGDAEQFAAALAAIDRRFGVRPSATPTGSAGIVVRRTLRGSARARLRAARRFSRRRYALL